MNDYLKSLGCIDHPLLSVAEFKTLLAETLLANVKEYAGTDNPQTCLLATGTLQEAQDYGTMLQRDGLRVMLITGPLHNMTETFRAVSAGQVDVVVMTLQRAMQGFRWPARRVLFASTRALKQNQAMQFVGRAYRDAIVSAMVWVAPDMPSPMVQKSVPFYPHMRVTFKEGVSAKQQEHLVWTLMEMGIIEKVELGNVTDYSEFVACEEISRSTAEYIHRILNDPNED